MGRKEGEKGHTVADLEFELVWVEDLLGCCFEHVEIDVGSVDALGGFIVRRCERDVEAHQAAFSGDQKDSAGIVADDAGVAHVRCGKISFVKMRDRILLTYGNLIWVQHP